MTSLLFCPRKVVILFIPKLKPKHQVHGGRVHLSVPNGGRVRNAATNRHGGRVQGSKPTTRRTATNFGKSSESVQCSMLKACDACADMGQL